MSIVDGDRPIVKDECDRRHDSDRRTLRLLQWVFAGTVGLCVSTVGYAALTATSAQRHVEKQGAAHSEFKLHVQSDLNRIEGKQDRIMELLMEIKRNGGSKSP